MASNIDTTAELNKLLQKQNELYLTQAKIMRGQMAMMKQMVEMFQQLNPQELTSGWNELGGAMEGASENVENAAGSGQQMLAGMTEAVEQGSSAMGDMGSRLKKLGKGLMALAGPVAIMETLHSGMQIAVSAASGLANIMMSVGSAIGNVAIAIITAPFKMLSTLINNVGTGSGELRQALEDVRKEFGDLRTGASKAILDISKGMQGQLAETGLRVYRVFGNLAERIKAIAEYAKQLGPLFNNLSHSLVANGEAFGAYVKGLGLTEDGLKGIGRMALITGRDFTELGREITGMAFGMGEAFGINGTQVSRAVGDMANDVKNFGSLSIKQLTQVAVFANRLGLEFQDLQGTIDRFDNFEAAADAAAQLSQAFGMNVDALQLVQEQDPAARFETLRKAFFQTGRSVEQMTRQEMSLLAAQTGLSEEAVKLGFSLESQGVNYADVQKQADLTQKKQLTQAEAMEKLSGSIERLVKSGEAVTGGFFERFFKGFLRGITLTKEFRGMMRALRESLRATFQAGRELGQVFVKTFPGVSDVFEGLRDYFNPTRWRKMTGGVVDAFRDFFKAVSTDPRAGLEALYKRLKGIFFDNFSAREPAGRKVIGGFGLFFKTIFNVAKAAIEIAIVEIRQRVTNIFTEGTTENGLAMGALKMLRRMRDAILEFPWRESLNSIKESLLTWFTDATAGIDWNQVATTMVSMLRDSLSFSMRTILAIGNVLMDIFHEVDWGLLAQILIGGMLVAIGPTAILSALWGAFTSALSMLWTAIAPFLLAGLEYVGGLVFTAIGGWPAIIVAALAAVGLAFLEWGDDLMDYASEALDEFGPMLASTIEEYLPVILEGLYNFLSNLPALFVEAIEWIGSAIKSSVEWLITSVSNLFTSSGNLDSALTRFFGRIGTSIGNVFASFMQTHFPNLYAGLQTMMNFFEGLRVLAGRAMDGIAEWKQRRLDPVIADFTETWQIIREMTDQFLTHLGGQWDIFAAGVEDTWTGIAEFMEPVLSLVREFLALLPTIGGTVGQSAIMSGPLGDAARLLEGITTLGAESQRVVAGTTQATTAAIADSAKEASKAVETTSLKTSATLTKTAQQATAQKAAGQSAVGAAATAPGSAAGTPRGGAAGAASTPDALSRRSALEELNSLRVPSPARVRRMESDIKNVTDRYTKNIAGNVRDLVAAVNTVTTDLEGIGNNPQRINVQLKQLANHLGVGGTQRLEIKNRNFTIQLNVNVVLDADEFEQALISRPGPSRFVVRPGIEDT